MTPMQTTQQSRKHSHFTAEALVTRICPVCGVELPVARPDEISITRLEVLS